MSGAEWERTKQVFAAALAMAPALRAAYLEECFQAEPQLRAPVEDLLSAHAEASATFLEPDAFSFDPPWLFRPGDTVAGRFLVTRAIARGAMGEVYEVRDERLRLRVALKAISPRLIGDQQTAERFRREVRVTREIAHEGLCRIFDLVEHHVGTGLEIPSGTVVPCLTMQLLDGVSLEEWLRTRRPLPPSDAEPFLRQIAAALDVLHDHGVVHRDLKPSNVMLVSQGGTMRAVLTDFGLARPINEGLFETQAKGQGGAPYFMAPELFRGDRPSRASDLYAFGLLIDEMVTEARAFRTESLHGLMLEKLEGRPRPPSERGTLPRTWDGAILRCLDPDPQARFTRATDVVSALTAPESTASRPARETVGPKPRGRAGPSWRYRYAAVAGATVLSLGGVGVFGDLLTPAGRHSVLVQPFANLTGDRVLDYLAVGTAAELGRRLSRTAGLVVYAPRDASAQVPLSQRAHFSLRGHVQRAGEQIRLTAELTDTAAGTLLWSQNFQGQITQALALEDQLAGDAVTALSQAAARRGSSWTLPRLFAYFNLTVPWRRPQVPASGTTSNEAFDAYLRGRYLFEERSLAGGLGAIQLLQRAVTLDPGYAAAYALLADVQGLLMDLHHAPGRELLAQAEEYATKAVELDPALPDAQLSLAAVRQMQSRWTDAAAAYERAIALHPAFARAHRWYAGMQLQFRKYDETLEGFRRSLELDPYDIPSQSALGLALFYAGRPLEAAAHLQQLVARRDHLHAHFLLGQVYAQLASLPGENREDYRERALQQTAILRDRVLAAARASGSPAPTTFEFADFVGALTWAYQGDHERALPFLDRLHAGHADGKVSPSILARVYAVLGRTEEAMTFLELAEQQQDRELMYLRASPLYARVQNEPRFVSLLQRVKLIP